MPLLPVIRILRPIFFHMQYFLNLPRRFRVQRASSLPPGSSTSITSTERISPSFESEGWEGKAEVSDWEPFRLLGRSMVDYIVDYYQRIEEFPVRPKVEPGYLKVHRA